MAVTLHTIMILFNRFGGQFTEWGQPFRLRHVVTGKLYKRCDRHRQFNCLCFLCTGDYLGIAKEDDNKLTLLPASKAELKLTRFRFRQSLVRSAQACHHRYY